jgi:predicted acetyltransferase
MSLKLVKYEDILIKDLLSIKMLLQQADNTEFIDDGRARTSEYEKFTYIQYNEKYIGYFNTRELHIGEICWVAEHLHENPEEYTVMAPMFITPDYQGIGMGRTVMKEFYSNKKGLVWIDDENIASQKMVEYAGFVHYTDGYFVKSL